LKPSKLSVFLSSSCVAHVDKQTDIPKTVVAAEISSVLSVDQLKCFIGQFYILSGLTVSDYIVTVYPKLQLACVSKKPKDILIRLNHIIWPYHKL